MSGHVVDAISESGVVKKVGVAVGIASSSLYIFPFNRFFQFQFRDRHVEFRMSAMLSHDGNVMSELDTDQVKMWDSR